MKKNFPSGTKRRYEGGFCPLHNGSFRSGALGISAESRYFAAVLLEIYTPRYDSVKMFLLWGFLVRKQAERIRNRLRFVK